MTQPPSTVAGQTSNLSSVKSSVISRQERGDIEGGDAVDIPTSQRRVQMSTLEKQLAAPDEPLSASAHVKGPAPENQENSSSASTGNDFDAQGPHPIHHIGLVNDYLVIPYANGSSFASQFIFRELRRTGHQVTVVGPHDPAAEAKELPPQYLSLPSLPVRGHPGLQLGVPSPKSLKRIGEAGFDAIIAQTGSALLELGLWGRRSLGIPFLAVYVFHVPSYYEVLLPEKIRDWKIVRFLFEGILLPFSERVTASVYNESDGLIVLAPSFENYWRERGVTVPITVIPRCIDPELFQRRATADPYESRAPKGSRLLCVCRHSPEKNIERLLRIFATEIAPADADATLTLVGDGQDSDDYRKLAKKLGIAERTFFPGEMPVNEMSAWYQHADIFTYSSLSETYGQVVTEAMWFGLPVVALDDHRGVEAQVENGVSGFLVEPGKDHSERQAANAEFAARTLTLLNDRALRSAMSNAAALAAETRSNPDATIQRYREALKAAHSFSTPDQRKKGFLTRIWALSRWSSLHILAVIFGATRAPSLKRPHGRRHPFWTRVDAVSPRAVKPETGDSAKTTGESTVGDVASAESSAG